MTAIENPEPPEGPYAAAVRAYWRAGWAGALPLPVRAKNDPPKGWTGAKGAWPSWPDIQAWIDMGHGAGNIALRLPPHVIGIDVDDYDDKHGADTLAALEAKYGPLPPTWKSTARDGMSGIRVYRVPEGLKWPGDLGNGIEVIQTRHRYLVAPPSIHPRSWTYRWVTPDGVTALPDTVPNVDTLPDLPDAWVTGLTGGDLAVDIAKADLGDAQVAAWLGDDARPKPCPVVEHSLRRYLEDLKAGGKARHDVATTATARLARLHGEGHAGAIGAILKVKAAWLQAIGSSRDDVTSAGEWKRAIVGAVQIAATDNAKPRTLDPCDWPTLLMPKPEATFTAPDIPDLSQHDEPAAEVDERAEEEAAARLEAEAAFNRDVATEVMRHKVREQARRIITAEGQTRRPEARNLATFLAEPDPPVTYRIDGLWPAAGRVMLTAAFKAGKSTLTANVIRCLVDGGLLLGRWTVEPIPGRVVLIDNELDESTLRRWLRDQGIQNPDKVTVIPLRGAVSSFDLLDQHVRQAWARVIKGAGGSVVVLDCLRPVLDAIGLDEHKDAGRFLTAFDELLGEAGALEALVVHHAGHEGERARGDSRLRDWPDVEWRLVREKGDSGDAIDPSARRYFAAYGRDVNVPEGALAFDETSRRLSYEGGSRSEAKATAALPKVIEALQENPDGLSGRGVEEYVTNAGHGRNEARKALRTAVERRLVKATPGRGGAVVHTLISASEALRNQGSAPVRHSAPLESGAPSIECASAPLGAHGALDTQAAGESAPGGARRTLVEGGIEFDPQTGEVMA